MNLTQYEPGIRVGAILDANEKTVRMLGFGTYVGDEKPPDFPIQNPKIELDDGSIVWGYQCWWGPEEQLREWIGEREVEEVGL